MSLLTELIERDGPDCVWCGRELWRADLTLEHLLPRSRGGHAAPENLAVACRCCNGARGSRPVARFVRAQLDAGLHPRLDVLAAALARLAGSPRRAQAQYGARQLDLLARLPAGEAQSRERRARSLGSASAPTATSPSTTAPAIPT